MKKHLALLTSATLTFTAPAMAADGHTHQGKNGGKVVETGHHHMEIVAKDGVLQVYLAHDDGKAEDVSGAKATATVLSEGKKEDVALSPDPANFLKGTGTFKAIKGTTIVVTLTMPGHKPEQARIKLD